LTKYIKYNVGRLAGRYVLYIYAISRLRVKWGLNSEVRIVICEQLDGWEIEYQ
jgi:hypothetical protein